MVTISYAQKEAKGKKSKFTVIADKRESRAGWRFKNIRRKSKRQVVTVESRHLVTGDYTILDSYGNDARDWFVIERKELSDLVQSCIGSKSDPKRRERFKLEHDRMGEIISRGGHAFVLIEGSPVDLRAEFGQCYRSVISTWRSWSQTYGIEWIWGGSKVSCEDIAFDLMERAEIKSRRRFLTELTTKLEGAKGGSSRSV